MEDMKKNKGEVIILDDPVGCEDLINGNLKKKTNLWWEEIIKSRNIKIH